MERNKKLEMKLKNANMELKRYKKTFKWIKKQLKGLIDFCESPYLEDVSLLDKTQKVNTVLEDLLSEEER